MVYYERWLQLPVTALSAQPGGTISTPLLPHFRIGRPRLINISFLFFAEPGDFF
jgi:hypothetical protein